MLKRIISLGIIICAIPSFLFSQSSNIGYNKTSTNDNIDFINVNREKDFIEIEIDFSKLPYQIVYNEKNEASIVMPQLGKNINAGEPELPKTIFRLGMLPNVKRESIKLKIIQQDITDLGAGYNITPVEAPRPALDGWNDQNYLNEEFESGRDLSIYNRDNLFPYSPIIISPLSNIKDWIFVSIELWPFQYNPKNSILKRVDYIKFRIDYKLDKTNIKQYDNDDSLHNKFHEPWKGSYKNSLPRDGNGYAIITTNDIISNSYNMNRFIECEENCGYSVSVITEDDYGSLTGQPPNGTAEKIRQWLVDNYLSLNIQYVLLIGDPDPDDPTDPDDHIGDIPMKMLYPRVGNGRYWNVIDSPSDYFYADLTGNWNLDGDELFGEQRSSSEPVTPDPQIEENTFSIRWTGKISVSDSSGINIGAFYDDGIKIWIDDLSGDPVIDDWSDHIANLSSYGIITPGLHDIKIEYYQNMSNSFFRLLKGSVGSSWFFSMQGSELYYWDGSSYQQGGLNGEYYNDMNLTDYVFSRIDPNNPSDYFNFKWFSGDRGDGGVDFSPEVSVGRIPVYDNDYSQLDEILDKMISYRYSSDISWRNNVLLPMKPFDGNTPNYQLGEQIRTELCEPNNFDYYRIYDEDYGCTPPPEATPCTQDNVLTAWQNPFGLVTWATHGWSSGASSVLTSSSCSQLNDYQPSFVFQGSCYNGYPEDSNNLGYSLLKHGAVATVSSSRASWYGVGTTYVNPGNLYIHGFCFYYSKYVIENNSVGESINLVKDVSANSLSDTKWMNIFDFNVYGNPALTLTCSPCEDSIPPSVPLLSLPINGSTISVNTPTFIWYSSIDTLSGVDYYILQYADNQNFTNTTSLNIIDTTYTPTYPLVDAIYYWRVKAIDYAGNYGNFTQTWNFEVDAYPLPTPTLVLPINDSWNNATVVFEWNSIETLLSTNNSEISFNKEYEIEEPKSHFNRIRYGREDSIRYVLQIDTTESFLNPIVVDTVETTIHTVNLVQNTYYWRVMAYNLAGEQSSFSERWNFGVDTTSPSMVTLISPDNQAYLNNDSINFVWNQAVDNLSGINHYIFQFSPDITFVQGLIDTALVDTTISLMLTLTDTTYYWRVKAVDIVENHGEFSTAWSFEIDTHAPAIPILISPLDSIWLTDTTVSFEWSDEGGDASPVNYIIQIDNTNSFVNPVVVDTVETTNHTVNLVENEYFWRVKSYDLAGNESQFSEYRNFGVDIISPSLVTLISPVDQAYLINDTINFVWHKATDNLSDISHYIFQYALDSSFSQGLVEITSLDTTFTAILPDNIYYWRVKAIDFAGNQGNFTQAWNFEVDAYPLPTPILVLPVENTWFNNNDVVFEWNSIDKQLNKNKENISFLKEYEIEKELKSNSNCIKNGREDSIRYVLQIDTTDSFLNPIVVDTLETTIHTVNLVQNIYYWRVRAYNLAGEQSAFSESWNFGIDTTSPSVVQLISPVDEASLINNMINFVWHQSNDNLSGINHYVIQCSPDSVFVQGLIDTVSADTTIALTLSDTTYYWRVRSVDLAGNQSNFSESFYFEAVLIPTVLTITSSNFTIESGKCQYLTASLQDDNGNPITGKVIRWEPSLNFYPDSVVTNSLGQASTYYWANWGICNVDVTITASFAGDNNFQAINGYSIGNIIENTDGLIVPPPPFIAFDPLCQGNVPGTAGTPSPTATLSIIPPGSIELETRLSEPWEPSEFYVVSNYLVLLVVNNVGNCVHGFRFTVTSLTGIAVSTNPYEIRGIAFLSPSIGDYPWHCTAPGHKRHGEIGSMHVDECYPAYTNIKVFFEGPYNAVGDTMECSLTLPTISPYDIEDIGSLPTVTGHSLVDWIQVKLRTTATGTTVDSCNAFLLEDGSVIDVNGNSNLPFYNTAGNEYYIVIHHRNHLDIMSAVKHTFGSSHGEATNIDLTISNSIYGDGYNELETGVYGMYSGDINNDEEVTTSDYTSWYNAYTTGSSGYQVTDLNLDGEVTTSDYTKWYNNFIVGASSSVPGQTRKSSGGYKKIILKKIETNTKKIH